MNILVTGGAGYIGSVVSERLLAFGHNPIIYDNLSEGHASAASEGVALVVADLNDDRALRREMREREVEAVIHLAASALVGESMADPSKYFRNNVAAGITLLDAMVECGAKRIVYSSTCAVYGEPESSPIPEDAPQRPSNPYGESKLAFEKMLRWYEAAHGLKYTSLRYFNAAGATDRLGEHHSPETHLIPIVLGCALGLRDEVEVYGDDYPTPDGTCVRDYVHVADIANAHILALDATRNRSAIYNLGTGKGYSVREVIESARRITNHPTPVRFAPRRAGDPAELVANPDLIKRELGWVPKRSELDSIVESAWEWHSAHPHGYEN
ncbi:MAG TPA: UDP-glucose 4-epimerase GalE [Blastocatellia bacterium]|nr:UDP-glucose 4-epimerase GalE [Blastocatellia bacterium]